MPHISDLIQDCWDWSVSVLCHQELHDVGSRVHASHWPILHRIYAPSICEFLGMLSKIAQAKRMAEIYRSCLSKVLVRRLQCTV